MCPFLEVKKSEDSTRSGNGRRQRIPRKTKTKILQDIEQMGGHNFFSVTTRLNPLNHKGSFS